MTKDSAAGYQEAIRQILKELEDEGLNETSREFWERYEQKKKELIGF